MSHVALPSEPAMRLVVLTHSPRTQHVQISTERLPGVEAPPSSTPDLHSWIDPLAESVRKRTDAIGAAVALQVGGELRCCGTAGNAPAKGTVVSVENTLVGECLRTGEVIRRDDPNRDISVVLAPIHQRNGAMGVLALFWRASIPISDATSTIARAATAMIEATLEPTYSTTEGCPGSPCTEHSEQDRASKKLYGLPCAKCGSYYYSDASTCPVCKPSGSDNV